MLKMARLNWRRWDYPLCWLLGHKNTLYAQGIQ